MEFSSQLISWYKKNKRDLPWRLTKDPYAIWLSEIILQQTRVDQGLSYYNKFIENYPTVIDLANATEESILNLWQGLGYYSRARNLHYTAKNIKENYNGIFPSNYDEILKLKGVGEYTAAAISSFSYNLCHPVIDGNVYRVLARIYGIKEAIDSSIGKNIFKNLAYELIDKKNPAIYNQAIMEFGALQCKPKNPDCENCPFILECNAFKNKLIDQLPYKEKKIKQRNRYFNYIVNTENNSLILNKKGENDIWQGLYDFPLIETTKSLTTIKELMVHIKKTYKIKPKYFTLKNISEEYKHILSHQKIHATFWVIEGINLSFLQSKLLIISKKEINNYPIPKLIENYLKTIL